MKKRFWSRSLLEIITTIRTLYFTWKFPFIKIVDFTGNMKDMQKAVNRKMNMILDSQGRTIRQTFRP